ncbi:hypothetical protein D9M69_681400 [compost metagenome]
MGVGARQAYGTIAQSVHHTRPEIFDQYVCFAEHSFEDIAVSRTFEVQRYALFASVEAHEVRRLMVYERTERTRIVSGGDPLDFDYPRAEIGQYHRAIGARQNTREV